jgi:SAM-dependent methyltransferase
MSVARLLEAPPELPLPPPSYRNHDDANYVASAVRDIQRIIDAVGISPGWRVLDLGCAAGRLALPLIRLLDPAQGGGYLGMDVKPGAIEWARATISVNYPHMRFEHLDARSGIVNPAGRINQSEVSLPVGNDTIDLVLLSSVFTHMLENGIRRYVSEIARCLKPGGTAYITAFLFDETTWMANSKRRPVWNFQHRLGSLAVHDIERPELAVAMFDDFILRITNESGLSLLALHKDAWGHGGEGGQDILYFKKA